MVKSKKEESTSVEAQLGTTAVQLHALAQTEHQQMVMQMASAGVVDGPARTKVTAFKDNGPLQKGKRVRKSVVNSYRPLYSSVFNLWQRR